jgi:DNA-binding transcriptional LysR family regulator
VGRAKQRPLVWQAEIDAILKLNAGRLRVGAFSSAGATLLADAVATFKARWPGIELSILEDRRDGLLDALRAGELDLAVVFDWPNASGLGADLELVRLLDEPHDLGSTPNTRSPAAASSPSKTSPARPGYSPTSAHNIRHRDCSSGPAPPPGSSPTSSSGSTTARWLRHSSRPAWGSRSSLGSRCIQRTPRS